MKSTGMLYGTLILAGLTVGFFLGALVGVSTVIVPIAFGAAGFVVANIIDRRKGLSAREREETLSRECAALDPWKRSPAPSLEHTRPDVAAGNDSHHSEL